MQAFEQLEQPLEELTITPKAQTAKDAELSVDPCAGQIATEAVLLPRIAQKGIVVTVLVTKQKSDNNPRVRIRRQSFLF